MKIDLAKRTDLGTRRTIQALVGTMFRLLQTESFEKILVRDICETALIPRATFYNYFEDKYDLLDYSWRHLIREHSDAHIDMTSSFRAIVEVQSQTFLLIEEHRTSLKKILRNNSIDGPVFHSFRTQFQDSMRVGFTECLSKENLKYSPEMTADYFSTILLFLFSKKLQNMETFRTEDARSFLEAAVDFNSLGMKYEKEVGP